jgi:hypothetical protein
MATAARRAGYQVVPDAGDMPEEQGVALDERRRDLLGLDLALQVCRGEDRDEVGFFTSLDGREDTQPASSSADSRDGIPVNIT